LPLNFKNSGRKVIGFTIRLSKLHCVKPERFEFSFLAEIIRDILDYFREEAAHTPRST
jgi:hypothetical protein